MLTYTTYPSENEIQMDKSGKMTAGPIKTRGFQFCSVIWFRQFCKKKKLVRDLPSRPCPFSGHVWEVLLFHWPFKGILSESIFSRHPISAITIDLSVSGIGFHKNVPVKMEQKRCSWQTIKKKITRNRWRRKTRKKIWRASTGKETKYEMTRGAAVGMLTIKLFGIYFVPIPVFS